MWSFPSYLETLPLDLRQIFDEVAVEAIRYSDEINREAEQEMINRLSEVLEVNHLSGEELKAFQQLAEEVYDYFIDSGVITTEEVREATRVARLSAQEPL